MPLAWLVLIVVPGILIWVFLGWQKLWLLLVWCGSWLLLFILVDIWEEHRWFKFSESGEPSIRPCPRCGSRADYRTRGRRCWLRCPFCGLEEQETLKPGQELPPAEELS